MIQSTSNIFASLPTNIFVPFLSQSISITKDQYNQCIRGIHFSIVMEEEKKAMNYTQELLSMLRRENEEK